MLALLPCPLLRPVTGVISTFRRVRTALWPMRFPVYASMILFPHPSASKTASGFMLLTRCLPRISNGLAVMSATLGSFYWLGFETSDLSSDKKRLALLGAQRRALPPGQGGAIGVDSVELLPLRNGDLFGGSCLRSGIENIRTLSLLLVGQKHFSTPSFASWAPGNLTNVAHSNGF